MNRMPESLAAELQKWSDEIDEHLKKGECPRCKKHIIGMVDLRQRGATQLKGVWMNYRCGYCDYAIDVVNKNE